MKTLTKNKAELLRIFFTNPDKFFYMHEIGRIVKKKPGVFQRTLNNMHAEGIVKSEYRANARYFKINRQYPLYKELKGIVFKTVGVVGSLKKILQGLGSVEFAFIYGSFAKAKENSTSDIDLAIIGSMDEDALIKKLDKLEESLQREINYKLYSLEEFKQQLRQKDPFVLEILKDKKNMILGEDNELRRIYKK